MNYCKLVTGMNEPHRFRFTSIIIVAVIATMSAVSLVITFSLVADRTGATDVALVQSASGRAYSNDSVEVNVTFSKYDRFLTIANRVVDNGWYNGPTNTMVQAPNGDYLIFVREGTSHVGDNGSMKLYRSVNNAIDFTMDATLRNVTDRDVRVTASGVTETGRIFVFNAIYDPLNETWPTLVEYQYSDNNGSGWTGPYTMSMPTVDGFTPVTTDAYGGNIWGTMRTLGAGRIGLASFFTNGTYVQERFIYSDNNGVIWNHVAMSPPTGPDPNFRSETTIIYLGDNRVLAVAREDATFGPDMLTSMDNGLTWTYRGYLPFSTPAGAMSALTLIKDTVGEPWVLLNLNKGAMHWWTIAYADDCFALGTGAWSTPVELTGYDEGDLWGLAPVTVFDSDTGTGFLTTAFESGPECFVLMFNVTASVTLLNYVDIVDAPVAFDIVHTEGMASCTYDGDTYSASTDVGGLLINMTVWNPGRNLTDQPVSQWNANVTDSSAEVGFTLSGLESGGIYYNVYVDGDRIEQIRVSDSGTIAFTYSGPWSEHIFEVEKYDPFGFTYDMAGWMLAVGFGVGIAAIAIVAIGSRLKRG